MGGAAVVAVNATEDTGADPDVETDTERHPIALRKVHPGDVTRVTTDEQTLDPAAALSVWPYDQLDFSPARHRDDLHTDRWARKDHTAENPVWEPVIRHRNRGIRVTFATEDGGRYAVVDWSQTDDPPLVYLLVFDGADPDARRWDRIGTDATVERYGAPIGDRSRAWAYRPPSEDIEPWLVEQDADPEFTVPNPGGER